MKTSTVSRREFVKASAATTAAVAVAPSLVNKAHAAGRATIRVGLIGCGGRGTGAATDSLRASESTQVVALGDVFADRVETCRGQLTGDADVGSRVKLKDSTCFTGFDAYKGVLAEDIDYVIIATPPHFRPIHFAEATKRGKHVFMEKPVGTDPTGIRMLLEAADKSESDGLCVVAGTQRRHERCYLEMIDRIRDGALGEVVAARCWWNMGFLWTHERRPEYSDMEAQLRNWLYYTWLSGDHIVEQHVHNIDVVNWVMGGPPIRARSLAGRQVRTDPVLNGNIYDHHAVEFEYSGNRFALSMCRQIKGCDNIVAEAIHGSKGMSFSTSGQARIEGENAWRFRGDNPNPYVVEHADLIQAMTNGEQINEARRVGESTLTAIMGRMSGYTGKDLTWDQALNSKLDLSPPAYEFGPLPERPVAVPGETPLI